MNGIFWTTICLKAGEYWKVVEEKQEKFQVQFKFSFFFAISKSIDPFDWKLKSWTKENIYGR